MFSLALEAPLRFLHLARKALRTCFADRPHSAAYEPSLVLARMVLKDVFHESKCPDLRVLRVPGFLNDSFLVAKGLKISKSRLTQHWKV